MELDKYIYPILGPDIDANGVLIGKYFVTAGHVIEQAITSYVTIDGKRYELSKDTALVFVTNEEDSSDGYDLAVFRFDDVSTSPLSLGDKLPDTDTTLICRFYTNKTTRTDPSKILSYSEESVFANLEGKVINVYNNYFECRLNGEVKVGNSGSPIMSGDAVVGILYGDKERKFSSKTVLFLSSKAIIRFLKELSIPIPINRL